MHEVKFLLSSLEYKISSISKEYLLTYPDNVPILIFLFFFFFFFFIFFFFFFFFFWQDKIYFIFSYVSKEFNGICAIHRSSRFNCEYQRWNIYVIARVSFDILYNYFLTFFICSNFNNN